MRFSPYASKQVVPSIQSLFSDNFINEVFQSFDELGSRQSKGFAPALDVQEDEKAFLVSAEIPGVAKGDIDISVKDNVLTIKGEKKSEVKDEKESNRPTWQERSFGSFERTVQLKDNVDANGVTASLENGVLKVTVPKAEDEVPTKISIN